MEEYVAVDGKRVAALDLSFNLGMDSIRNSRAIPVVERLQERGAIMAAYDPVAATDMEAELPDTELISYRQHLILLLLRLLSLTAKRLRHLTGSSTRW